jgi:hypothetical protein
VSSSRSRSAPGSRPGTVAETTTLTTPVAAGQSLQCVVIDRATSDPCGRRAVAAQRARVHEHVYATSVCVFHLHRGEGGELICRPCREVDGHVCRGRLLRESAR